MNAGLVVLVVLDVVVAAVLGGALVWGAVSVSPRPRYKRTGVQR